MSIEKGYVAVLLIVCGTSLKHDCAVAFIYYYFFYFTLSSVFCFKTIFSLPLKINEIICKQVVVLLF